MKVLHIGKFFAPYHGGMESHLQQLCPGLAKSVDLDVVVFGNPDEEYTEQFGFRLHRVRTQGILAGSPISFGMTRLIASIPADIVHIHHPNPMGIFAFIASRHRGRLVVTYHSDIVRQKILKRMLAPLLALAWKRTIRFSVASPDYIASSPVLSQNRDRAKVIPHGINLETLSPPDVRGIDEIRNEYPGFLLLGVGRLVEYKGFDYLIDAFSLLKGLPHKTHLVIIGVGPLKKALENKIADLKLGDTIHLLDRVEDLRPYYAAADIFVLPSVSRAEAYGFVQVEAMAYSTPVINTKLETGVPFVSVDGITGFTVPPRDASALAGAIRKLLEDENLRLRMGSAAKKRAYSEFSASKMVERTMQMYEEILRNSA